MTDLATDTGNPVANQSPVPQASPETPAPANKDAQRAANIRAAFDKAAASTGKPVTEAAQGPTKEAPVDVPQFFTKKKAAEEAPFDPSKLSPELQTVYKQIQADATKKWQDASDLRKQAEADRAALVEERKAMVESQKALIEALRGRTEPTEPGATDPMAQIQNLRDEGRHAEADALMLQVAQKFAEAQTEPMKREAQLNVLKTTFRDTASDVMLNNPVVQRYKDDVVKTFDGDSPVMQTLRPFLLQNEQSIRTFVPLVLNAIATELHAKALEENFEKAVEAKVNAAIESRRSSAGRVPARLVESGGGTKESPPGKMSLAESVRLALDQTKTS